MRRSNNFKDLTVMSNSSLNSKDGAAQREIRMRNTVDQPFLTSSLQNENFYATFNQPQLMIGASNGSGSSKGKFEGGSEEEKDYLAVPSRGKSGNHSGQKGRQQSQYRQRKQEYFVGPASAKAKSRTPSRQNTQSKLSSNPMSKGSPDFKLRQLNLLEANEEDGFDVLSPQRRVQHNHQRSKRSSSLAHSQHTRKQSAHFEQMFMKSTQNSHINDEGDIHINEEQAEKESLQALQRSLAARLKKNSNSNSSAFNFDQTNDRNYFMPENNSQETEAVPNHRFDSESDSSENSNASLQDFLNTEEEKMSHLMQTHTVYSEDVLFRLCLAACLGDIRHNLAFKILQVLQKIRSQ